MYYYSVDSGYIMWYGDILESQTSKQTIITLFVIIIFLLEKHSKGFAN